MTDPQASDTNQFLKKKLDSIESLLNDLNEKIDNYLGVERISEDEKKEIESIRAEVESGRYETMDEVFED